MSESKEKSLEELRKMSSKELASYFNMEMRRACALKRALKPGYYEILTNNTLSVSEMVEKLGINKSIAATYRESLIKAGLAERKINRGVKREVIELLYENPLTSREIKEKVDGFSPSALYQKDIGYIGPRR